MTDPNSSALYDNSTPANRTRVLQKMLRAVGEAENDPALFTAVNGEYDNTTRSAVRAFQAKYGLPVTGTVNYITWQKLSEASGEAVRAAREPVALRAFAAGQTLRRGEVSDLVLILQIVLGALRSEYDQIPPVPHSGVYDGATESAVRAFQKASLLDATGEVNQATWDRLAADYNQIAHKNA